MILILRIPRLSDFGQDCCFSCHLSYRASYASIHTRTVSVRPLSPFSLLHPKWQIKREDGMEKRHRNGARKDYISQPTISTTALSSQLSPVNILISSVAQYQLRYTLSNSNYSPLRWPEWGSTISQLSTDERRGKGFDGDLLPLQSHPFMNLHTRQQKKTKRWGRREVNRDILHHVRGRFVWYSTLQHRHDGMGSRQGVVSAFFGRGGRGTEAKREEDGELGGQWVYPKELISRLFYSFSFLPRISISHPCPLKSPWTRRERVLERERLSGRIYVSLFWWPSYPRALMAVVD